MTAAVIRVLGIAWDPAEKEPMARYIAPRWIESFDVDAYDGRGDVKLTCDLARALRFEDVGAALQAYRLPSKCRPLRPDGKPNRPLTAYTVEIERVA